MGENLFFISVNFHFTLGLIFHAKTVTVFMQVELSQFMIEFAKKKKKQKQNKKNKKKKRQNSDQSTTVPIFFHSK